MLQKNILKVKFASFLLICSLENYLNFQVRRHVNESYSVLCLDILRKKCILALVIEKIALGNNVFYRMWELTDVLSDYLHYWHWSARKKVLGNNVCYRFGLVS
ncbi:hypothetical protein CDAR_40761 [Caerostris darwini]|uniref:Secreted protein n=1 Tax=Caerostris darwini TaxID=1538125 RepID=A0AAV4R194_9ARAC|nr:hypothetical protein CDAR_40761 [Caerostris darwini]